ncbi:MAG: cytochrome c [Bacteroidetes bacterium]|nr:cytochrome c [Bacteroidota bacterium]
MIRRAVLVLLVCLFGVYSGHIYLTPTTDGSDPAVQAGKMIWQKKNCTACHQLYGLGGFLGPDLTNIYSAKGPDYIKSFVQGGTATMPAFILSDNELKSLIEFLKHVDETGRSDPRRFKINLNGTIASN